MKNVYEINGGKQLFGSCKVQTSKNAILPIMSACLLSKGDFILYNYPKISDVDNMISILQKIGVKIVKQGQHLTIDTNNAINAGLDAKLSKSMRSSIFLLGSTLARFKNVMITLPGGCDIGRRPIDIHMDAMAKLNVKVLQLGENVFFNAENAKAGKVKLKIPSVGATENLVQFASTLQGKTTILNAAREPEVVDLCNFLSKMGAKIYGIGTTKLTIYGVNNLRAVTYRPMGDRIVAGTIMCAVALCGGKVTISNSYDTQNSKLIKILCSMGCQIQSKNDIIQISSDGNLKAIDFVETGFYPDFATDLQSVMLATCLTADGSTIVKENLFENRFLVVDELKKMGATLQQIDSRTVKIYGTNYLKGANLVAKDLRGGASLIVAALKAKGQSTIENLHYIDRGYENFEQVLTSLGADIKRV